MTSIITLTTDFGTGSPYVAAMKGVILGINPAAQLVDISHEVGPQDVRHGAVLLAEATGLFPPASIHLGVVDPGVGTGRRLIYARVGDQHYLAPDNGLLSLLAKRNRPARIFELANTDYWLPVISHTFHGRDILAPVAAQLSLGLEGERLGPARQDLLMLDWPEPRRSEKRIEGAVQWIDHFGNLISNISGSLLPSHVEIGVVRIRCQGREVSGMARAYGERAQGELTALVGSSGHLEVAVVNGSAAEMLGAAVGAPVVVEF